MATGLPEVASWFHIMGETIIALTPSIFSFRLISLPHQVLNICNLIAIEFVLGCAFAPTTDALLAFRYLAGVSGSAPIACGGGVVSDLFSERDHAVAMAIYSLGPVIRPGLGPIMSGFVTGTIGIKYVFIIVAGLGGVASAPDIPFLKETYAPLLRLRLAKKAADPEKATLQHAVLVAQHSSKLYYLWINLSRPAVFLSGSPVCFMLSLYMAFLYGNSLFSTMYGFNMGTSGLTYLGLGIGFVIATAISKFTSTSAAMITEFSSNTHIIFLVGETHCRKGELEMRIPALIFGSLFVPVGLLWLVRLVGSGKDPLNNAHHRIRFGKYPSFRIDSLMQA
ncbi:major facilitator superfamily domain-containing protein [Mycena galopus ATCC 62051]|nr:major facilitator superfamily domain-containing protein [Mycena galopus ATCC 62051]